MSGKAVEPVSRIVPDVMSDEDRASMRDQFERQIAEATTVDALFEKPKPLSLDDIEGVPVYVTAARFMKGRDEYNKNPDSLGAYMAVEFSRTEDGDTEVLTTGARTPVMMLYRVAELGGFPLRVRFIKNRTGNDRDAWDVERA